MYVYIYIHTYGYIITGTFGESGLPNSVCKISPKPYPDRKKPPFLGLLIRISLYG